MTKQPGGFMSDIESTTKSTANFINEQIASNPVIIEQAIRIDKIERCIGIIASTLDYKADDEIRIIMGLE